MAVIAHDENYPEMCFKIEPVPRRL